MSFDKMYPNRKDWRKQYVKKASICDRTCRPNGGCDYCKCNRLHSTELRKLSADSTNEAVGEI